MSDLGVKYVDAKTYEGAIYGLGFIHARDRLWQLQFFRMLSSGKMSEMVGREGLEVDVLFRTLGLNRIAKK